MVGEGAEPLGDGVYVCLLHDVIGGAELAGIVVVGVAGGGGIDNYGQGCEAGLLAKPGEHFKAATARQFEVEQNQAGQWVLGAVGASARAVEIVNGLDAVHGDLQRGGQAGALEGQRSASSWPASLSSRASDAYIGD